MRRILLSVGLFGGLLVAISQAVQSQSESKKQGTPDGRQGQQQAEAKPAADRSADEAAIRANVARFVKAYNSRDAKAIAALFTPDGQVVDKEGNKSEGRDEIAQTFDDIFKALPKKHLEVNVESIRAFIGSDLAMEVGTTKESFGPDEPPEYDRYTVLHVKRDGKWQMALARDEEGPIASGRERLRPLAWLVGEWVDDGGSAVVISSCRWSKDGNFLLHDFKLEIDGRDELNVSQRIGWDPLTKHIRAWVFDSEGGFGESVWTRDGSGWIIKATGVCPD